MIENLNGYSEDLMKKVLEYLQMLEEQIFQNEKGQIEVYEKVDDVKSLIQGITSCKKATKHIHNNGELEMVDINRIKVFENLTKNMSISLVSDSVPYLSAKLKPLLMVGFTVPYPKSTINLFKHTDY